MTQNHKKPDLNTAEKIALVKKIERLEKQLIDLQSRMPAHSTPPTMMAELDALEEALSRARSRLDPDIESPDRERTVDP